MHALALCGMRARCSAGNFEREKDASPLEAAWLLSDAVNYFKDFQAGSLSFGERRRLHCRAAYSNLFGAMTSCAQIGLHRRQMFFTCILGKRFNYVFAPFGITKPIPRPFIKGERMTDRLKYRYYERGTCQPLSYSLRSISAGGRVEAVEFRVQSIRDVGGVRCQRIEISDDEMAICLIQWGLHPQN